MAQVRRGFALPGRDGRGTTVPPVVVAVVVAVVLALVAVVVVRVVDAVSQARRGELATAVRLAPAQTLRMSWTDWAGVREELGLADEAGSPTDRDVDRLLRRAFDADLSPTSALVGSAKVAQATFGFSPATATWELFSQGEDGALITLRMPGTTDFAELADALRELGFTEPDEPDGVWRGGPDVLTRVGANLTPELQHVALDAEAGLVRSSDDAGFLAAHLDGSASFGDDLPEGLDDVVGALGSPLAATVLDGEQACRALAMASADAEDQELGRSLVARAGEVSPVTAYGMGVLPGGDVRAALGFEDDDQARRNADSRAALATGPAPGQGGDFADRFALDEARAEGRVVTLDLDPVDGAYVLSDLGSGPVLFATC